MNEKLRNNLYQLLMLFRGYSVDRWRYHYCRWKGVAYFGAYMGARQGCPERYLAMDALIQCELQKYRGTSYQVLEVGSWAGGSALIWGKALKADNRKANRLVCVDPWGFYVMESDAYLAKRLMSAGFRHDAIYRLFRHNTACGDIRDVLIELRGDSQDVLPMLAPEKFNFVYVDGNHSYQFVKADLAAAGSIVAEGGILCGDDLELQTERIDEGFARAAGAKDYIKDPKNDQWYHPGVTLAVGEFFGKRVSEKAGFWAMRKAGGGWIEVA